MLLGAFGGVFGISSVVGPLLGMHDETNEDYRSLFHRRRSIYRSCLLEVRATKEILGSLTADANRWCFYVSRISHRRATLTIFNR